MYSSWSDVSAEIERFVADDKAGFEPQTVENARLFIAFADARYLVADDVGPGYWPTISLSWSIGPEPIAVEIFQDHYEFYRFFDGRTEISEFLHTPDDPFPQALKMLLDTAIGQTGAQ